MAPQLRFLRSRYRKHRGNRRTVRRTLRSQSAMQSLPTPRRNLLPEKGAVKHSAYTHRRWHVRIRSFQGFQRRFIIANHFSK